MKELTLLQYLGLRVLPPPGFTYFTLGNAEVTTKAEPDWGRQRKGKKKAHARMHALTHAHTDSHTAGRRGGMAIRAVCMCPTLFRLYLEHVCPTAR